MSTLRPYQSAACDSIEEHFKDDKKKHNAIVVAPTGSGKSHLVAETANRAGEPILVFQPSKEILEQNYTKITDTGTLDVSIFSASMNSKKISRITLATIGSVINKPDLFQHFKYILIDECHLVNPHDSMYKRFLQLAERKVVGLTATPYRLYNNRWGSELRFLTRTREKVFSEMIHYTQIQELAALNYFAKLKYFPVEGFEPGNLKVNSTGSSYTDESIKLYYNEIKFTNKLIRCVDRLLTIGRKNILIFTKFVEEAKAVSDLYGDLAALVTGETPKPEREKILADYKSGKIKIIANVGVLTTGFDYPELETVVVARPTRSLSLWYQMIGRLARPHPLKEYGMVVDLCGNYDIFGAVEDLRIDKNEKGLWCIKSGNTVLTNRFLEDVIEEKKNMKLFST